MTGILCDQAGCPNLATIIVQVERKQTGAFVSYWCVDHAPRTREEWDAHERMRALR